MTEGSSAEVIIREKYLIEKETGQPSSEVDGKEVLFTTVMPRTQSELGQKVRISIQSTTRVEVEKVKVEEKEEILISRIKAKLGTLEASVGSEIQQSVKDYLGTTEAAASTRTLEQEFTKFPRDKEKEISITIYGTYVPARFKIFRETIFHPGMEENPVYRFYQGRLFLLEAKMTVWEPVGFDIQISER